VISQYNFIEFQLDLIRTIMFHIAEEPTRRVNLMQVPYSKSLQFGKDDVNELIFMMEVMCHLC
jgi:hypothetical protein